MFDKYQIKNGDSILDISKKYNVEKEYLLNLNNIYNEQDLRVGMEIIVPKTKEKYFDIYTIKSGDTLYKISEKYNINPELLANMNGLNMTDYIYPNQELIIPKSGYSYYITNEGDTLSLVASRFNTNINKLLEENDTIYLLGGQLLVSKRK